MRGQTVCAGRFDLISIERHIDGRPWNMTVWERWLAGLFLAVGFMAMAMDAASEETRTVKR